MRWLQDSLGLPATGLANAATLAAAHRADPRALIEAFSRQCLSFLTRPSTWASFGRGGSAAVAATRKAALPLAGPGSLLSGRKKGDQAHDRTQVPVLVPHRVGQSRRLDAVLLSIFGFDTSIMDSPGMADAIEQSVAGICVLASTIFRVIATRRLAMV